MGTDKAVAVLSGTVNGKASHNTKVSYWQMSGNWNCL